MTSMTQDFEKVLKFLDTSVLLVTLNSYHRKLIAPIVLKKTLGGSQKKFSEKNLCIKWL